jgi:eukaryotic-like serine/threonine-protein kinase
VTTQTPWREQSSPGSPPPSGERATPGTVVGGRYELKTPIGNGGMGTVWRAADTLLRRDVAVKEVLLPPTMPQNEKDALCERTLREARAAAALSHPSVVQVYDVVTDGGRPWIVMELLEARSLADMVIDDGPMAPRAVAKIGIAMLGALEVAHAAGVLHRDVKPANVLICNDGRCVLTDFGVARLPTESKLTTPGMVLGSPHFISPERAVGGAFGPPSDLFSLGVTLYTAVEGGPPFDRGDPFETMRAVVEEAPRPARLAGPLKPVLMGLLDKEPSRRWSVEQARAVLRELLTGTLGPTRNAHLRHDTDPVAVIRPPAGPPPAVRPPGSQVGGRAMLDPDEPLSGQIARLREAAGIAETPHQESPSGAIPRPLIAESPSGAIARGGGGRVADTVRAETGRTPGSWAEAATTADGPSRWRGQPAGRRRAPSGGAVLAERVRTMGQDVRRSQGRSRLVMAGGLVALLLIVAIGAWSGWFSSSPSDPPGPQASAGASSAPLIEAQEYRDRGIVMNVPAGWARGGSGSYVDYKDPADARWVRINIEPTTATAMAFLQNAENGLKDPDRCPTPYGRVQLHEAPLAGQNGAELEYTCGAGDAKRHGIWRALVVNGNAFHFYLTVPDARFGESKIIFDEMVRSFQFAT